MKTKFVFPTSPFGVNRIDENTYRIANSKIRTLASWYVAKFVLMAVGFGIAAGATLFFPEIPWFTSPGLAAISLVLLLWVRWWYIKQMSTTLTVYLGDEGKVKLLFDQAQASAGTEHANEGIADIPTMTADVTGFDVTLARGRFFLIPLPAWVVYLSAGRIDFKKDGVGESAFWLTFVANPYGIIEWLKKVRTEAAKVEETKKKMNEEEREVKIVAKGVTQALNELRAKPSA